VRAAHEDIVRRPAAAARVVHAAGALNDALLADQRWDDARAVLRGKAHGAMLLHELTLGQPLDFFVLYFGAAVLLGAAGQGLYPAPRGARRARRPPRARSACLRSAWPGAPGPGRAWPHGARKCDRGRVSRRSRPRRRSSHWSACWAKAWRTPPCCRSDWARFMARAPAGGRSRVLRSGRAQGGGRHGRHVVPAGLRALPAAQRPDALQRHLRERLLQVTGAEPATAVDPRAALKDLGLDSRDGRRAAQHAGPLAPSPLPATLSFD